MTNLKFTVFSFTNTFARKVRVIQVIIQQWKASSVVHLITMVHYTPFNFDKGVEEELANKSFSHTFKMRLNATLKCG